MIQDEKDSTNQPLLVWGVEGSAQENRGRPPKLEQTRKRSHPGASRKAPTLLTPSFRPAETHFGLLTPGTERE